MNSPFSKNNSNYFKSNNKNEMMIYSDEKQSPSNITRDQIELMSSQAFANMKRRRELNPMQRALFGKYVKVKATSVQNKQTGVDPFSFSVSVGSLKSKEFNFSRNE